MFFGVPVCACLYSLVAFLVDRRLAEKDLPVETEHYTAPLPDESDAGDIPEKGGKTVKKACLLHMFPVQYSLAGLSLEK